MFLLSVSNWDLKYLFIIKLLESDEHLLTEQDTTTVYFILLAKSADNLIIWNVNYYLLFKNNVVEFFKFAFDYLLQESCHYVVLLAFSLAN